MRYILLFILMICLLGCNQQCLDKKGNTVTIVDTVYCTCICKTTICKKNIVHVNCDGLIEIKGKTITLLIDPEYAIEMYGDSLNTHVRYTGRWIYIDLSYETTKKLLGLTTCINKLRKTK